MLSASLYDRLERAIIAMEYALADARSWQFAEMSAGFGGVSKAQDDLQRAGEEVQDVLFALKSQALRAAASRARAWAASNYIPTPSEKQTLAPQTVSDA